MSKRKLKRTPLMWIEVSTGLEATGEWTESDTAINNSNELRHVKTRDRKKEMKPKSLNTNTHKKIQSVGHADSDAQKPGHLSGECKDSPPELQRVRATSWAF